MMNLVTRLLSYWFGGLPRPAYYDWNEHDPHPPRWPTVTVDEQQQAEAIARRLYV